MSGRIRERGTTLLETLVAAVIVLLVLLSLIGVIVFSLQGVRSAEGHQEATFQATKLLELIRDRDLAVFLGFNDLDSARVPLHAAPFAADFPAGTGLTRRIRTARLSNDATNYQYKVYRVEVTVFWKIKGRESHFTVEGITRAP